MPATARAGRRTGRRPHGSPQVEADRLRRIRLPRLRQGDQPAQRLLRSEVERQRDALLVDLGSDRPAAASRRGATTRSPALALEAIYEYWNADGHNETSAAGVVMVDFAFSCVWSWDARPFPTFPLLASQWGDAGDWATGNWLSGRGPALAPPAPSPAPTPGDYPTFPTLATLGWSTHMRPRFATDVADHVSGRATRRPSRAEAYYDVELTYELLRADAVFSEMQTIAGFFAQMAGAATPFWLAPPGLANVAGQILGVGDGATTRFALARTIGGAVEPVAGTSGVSAVYLDGAPLPASAWSCPAAMRRRLLSPARPPRARRLGRLRRPVALPLRRRRRSTSRSSWRCCSRCRRQIADGAAVSCHWRAANGAVANGSSRHSPLAARRRPMTTRPSSPPCPARAGASTRSRPSPPSSPRMSPAARCATRSTSIRSGSSS